MKKKITEKKTTFSNNNKVEKNKDEPNEQSDVGEFSISVFISKPNGPATALIEQHSKTAQTHKKQQHKEERM